MLLTCKLNMSERPCFNTSASNEITENSPAVLSAKAEIQTALNEYRLRIKTVSADLDQWRAFCQIQSERYGETSVLTLLPNSDERIITGTIRSLVIRNQIATKTDLVNLDPGKIAELKGIGQKSAALISAMRNLAIAQLH